jgi:uncharacterized protein YndB with AHSA1/START domain
MGLSDEYAVLLTRVLRAAPGEVFSAWTEPPLIEQWWAGVGGWTEAHAEVDLRVGGHYLFTMRDGRGAVDGVGGVYTDVSRPDRLGFTWTWENDPSVMRGSEGSLVDLVLREEGGGTQLSLTHTGLGSSAVQELHEDGWNALLTSLFGLVSA